jgi:hypothetical protein
LSFLRWGKRIFSGNPEVENQFSEFHRGLSRRAHLVGSEAARIVDREDRCERARMSLRLLLARASRAWLNRHVTFLGPDPQVFMLGEFHFDLAEFAVVIAIGRLVSDQILAAQLARDSR